MFACTGLRTTIVAELSALTGEAPQRIDADLADPACAFVLPSGTHRYVLAAGVLRSKPLAQWTGAELVESACVNFANVVRLCEAILEADARARICVIGSESGFAGSFDRMYGAAKAAVHAYVSTRPVQLMQQLVCVAPPIIRDSGMTERRHDYPGVLHWRPHTSARAVAAAVHALLWAPRHTASTGTVYRVPAGCVHMGATE